MKKPVIEKRFDVVGSFLRPESIKKAREDFSQNKITAAELRQVEDDAIRTLIDKQIDHGLYYITDGEYRRSWWHLDFFWGFHGIDKVEIASGYKFHDETTRGETAQLSDKLRFDGHPFLDDFLFVKEVVGDRAIPKQTIPAPAQLYNELIRQENIEATERIYPDREDLKTDIVNAYRDFIQAFYDAGGRILQMDDCTWGTIVDKDFIKTRVTLEDGASIDDIVEQLGEVLLELNNRTLADWPEDLIINTHVCRGNYHSTWAASGGYGPVAPYLFAREDVNALYLEFDTERAGTFEPLQEVTDDKAVVLGLITSKKPELENKEDVLARLKEATKFIPKERLLLSPQCGFASTEEGNKLTEEDQWKKIDLVREIAEEFWQ